MYSVGDLKLVLNGNLSGKPLTYSRLCSDQVVRTALLFVCCIIIMLLFQVNVYDFGSEVYVWSGKHTSRATRRRAIQWSQRLCASNDRFPSWGLFCPIVEGHEPLLFREKFSDWPEQGRIIKLKGHVCSGEEVEVCTDSYSFRVVWFLCNILTLLLQHSSPELLPVPPEVLLSPRPINPSPCVLESVNIGRGKGHGDYIVETQSVTVWQVHVRMRKINIVSVILLLTVRLM